MKLNIKTFVMGKVTEIKAETQPKQGDLRMPMKKAAIAAMKQNGARNASVEVEHAGAWSEIMSVGAAERPGQYWDTFTTHFC